jgi:predicted AAA+ superfamily ATPase
MYIPRVKEKDIKKSLSAFPVTAIIGPRQCGKSTLAKKILEEVANGLYLDLERPSDLSRLNEPELYLSSCKGKLICIDEIQRKPEIFPLIRSLVDEWGTKGSFLLLGSASRDLLRQSSESLAGRISYQRLTPFLWKEIANHTSLSRYMADGAFPGSILADNEEISFEWRENFIQTFLERDLHWWTGGSPESVRRLWTMLAHENGQTVNYTKLGTAMGMSDSSVRKYTEALASTFMLEIVKPYFSNAKKRLVKAPKIYIADAGITTALLQLRSYENLVSHPAFGAIWEQIVLSEIKGHWPNAEVFYYRSAGGAEIDFVIELRGKVLAVECKASLSPTLTKGTYSAIQDIQPEKLIVAAPIKQGWLMKENVTVAGLQELCGIIGENAG